MRVKEWRAPGGGGDASPAREQRRPGDRGVTMAQTATRTAGFVRLVPEPGARPAPPLPISKLRGLTAPLRTALKRRGITTCPQLLRAAGRAADRDRLAREAGTDPAALLALVRRA